MEDATTDGALLFGRFQVRRELGEGGFGTVLHCHDRVTGQDVALKQLHRFTADALLRFKAEFRAVADLQHPNLVQLWELVESSDRRWAFSMELVSGPDFVTWVRAGQPAPHFDESRLHSGLAQLVRGLDALHQLGMVHRDIKPDNLLVTPEGRVVILDFGLVTHLASERLTTQGTCGTALYMAPEQAEQVGSVASDYYALGVTLYELLTGCLPFSGNAISVLLRKTQEEPPPPSAHHPQVCPRWERVCMQLLQRDPSARPGATELLEQLGEPFQGESLIPSLPAREPANMQLWGREAELDALDAEYSRADTEGFRVLRLEGGSGIGKTTLVDHWVQRQQSREPSLRVFRGRCHAAEQLRYKAWDGVVDSLCNYLRGLDELVCRSLLPPDLDLLTRLFPVLAKVPAIPALLSKNARQDPTEERFAAFIAFGNLLEAVARDAPVVLCVDDLQWSDLDSLALLETVCGLRRRPRVLLIATVRPEAELPNPLRERLDALAAQYPSFTRLTVGPLSGECTRTMCAQLLWSPPDSPSVRHLAEQTGGNPWLARELVGYAGQQTDANLSELDLETALRARVDALGEDASRVMQLLSIAAGPQPTRVLQHALELPPERVRRTLTNLRVRRLVGAARRGHWRCDHDRVREAVAAAVSPALAARLHGKLACAWEAFGGDPLRIAHHYTEAHERVRANPWLEHAAHDAMQAGAFDQAARLYQQLLAHQTADGADIEALQRRRDQGAEALAAAGRCAESAQLLLTMRDHATGAARARLQVRAAERLLQAGKVQDGLEAARQACQSVDLPWPQTAAAVRRSTIWQRARGRLAPRPRRTKVDARRQAQLETLAPLLHPLGWIDAARSLEMGARSLLLARASGDKAHICRALLCQFLATIDPRFWEKAEPLLDAELPAELQGLWHFARSFIAGPEALERSIALYRGGAPQAAWTLANVRAFQLRWRFVAAPDQAWADECARSLLEANLRGDVFAALLLSTTGAAALRHLREDEPERAVAEVQRLLEGWQLPGIAGGLYLNGLSEVTGVQSYAGSRQALDTAQRLWGINPVPGWPQAAALFCGALCALADGDDAAAPREALGRVRSLLERKHFAKIPDAQHVLAQLDWLDGNRAGALELATCAERGLCDWRDNMHARGMSVLKAFCNSPQQGQKAAAELRSWYAELGWKNPERAITLSLPVYPLLKAQG